MYIRCTILYEYIRCLGWILACSILRRFGINGALCSTRDIRSSQMPSTIWRNYGLCHCHRVTHCLSTKDSNRRASSAPHPLVYLSRACPKTLMLGTNWSMEGAKLQHMNVMRRGSKVPNTCCNGIEVLSMNAELMSKYGEHPLTASQGMQRYIRNSRHNAGQTHLTYRCHPEC